MLVVHQFLRSTEVLIVLSLINKAYRLDQQFSIFFLPQYKQWKTLSHIDQTWTKHIHTQSCFSMIQDFHHLEPQLPYAFAKSGILELEGLRGLIQSPANIGIF